MRAREFVINVPITIKIDGDGEPVVNDHSKVKTDYAREKTTIIPDNPLPPKDPSKLDPNPIMIPPLQQNIELQKAQTGKISPVIDELTQDEIEPGDSRKNSQDLIGEF